MEKEWLITFRSVTYAQKGEAVLKRGGIHCTLQRTPKILSERGCGYCLRLRGNEVLAAVEKLKQQQVAYGKCYAITASGRPEERVL